MNEDRIRINGETFAVVDGKLRMPTPPTWIGRMTLRIAAVISAITILMDEEVEWNEIRKADPSNGGRVHA